MSVAFGCYLESKNKSSTVDEEPPEVFDGDPSMHVAIEVEKRKSYQSIEQRVWKMNNYVLWEKKTENSFSLVGIRFDDVFKKLVIFLPLLGEKL